MSTIDHSALPRVVPWCCWLVSTIAFLPAFVAISRVPALAPPLHGERGRRRRMAREDDSFRSLEPLLQLCGAGVRALSWRRICARADQELRKSSYPAGLWPEELIAACIVGAIAGMGCALCLSEDLATWLPVAALVGAAIPWLRIRDVGKSRALALERGLPAAMDLCVLCMGAGADFPAALRFAVEELDASHPVCTEELAMVLEELVLGRTRIDALTHLAERTSSDAVQDFVAAVCQSEQKGTPVGDALSLQATALRQKRSVKAEELAAKTAVRLTLPLMMTLVCVMLLLFGPFIARGGL